LFAFRIYFLAICRSSIVVVTIHLGFYYFDCASYDFTVFFFTHVIRNLI